MTGELESFGLIALAGGLGALVGLEREFAHKAAGFRTHIFVCAGSALLMILGAAIVDEFEKNHPGPTISSDPVRVLQAIVIGISFLGAGTIIHRGSHVEGLTTASSIFLTAGIGVAVAIDRVLLAVTTTCFAVTVLFVIGAIQRWIEGRTRNVNANSH
jgi:putative Mg2+ transporter-C (MgtC) family protein